MEKFYFIRHGESVANTRRTYQGQTHDTNLSPLGVKQANALADRLETEIINRIIASPLKRTMQTAQMIASRHAGLSVEIESRIIETNHGEWEGKTIDVIEHRWPEMYAAWKTFPSKVVFPGGEAFYDTQVRVLNWWREIVATTQGTTVVIAHDNIVRALLVNLLGKPTDAIWEFELQPTGISCVSLFGGNPIVEMINDIKHLEGLQANLANHAL